MFPKRFELYLVNLDPTIGSEIKKTRPCVIISPDEMNKYISTVIVAPVTSKLRNYPTRIKCTINKTPANIVLDQIRTVDKSRLIKKISSLTPATQKKVSSVLVEMFTL